jgi:hypothetical protein
MSGLTDQDARALTYLARRLRAETHGCREWDDAGTYAKVASLIGQNLAMTIERVLCHATDPEAKTPGAILRPFLTPRPSEQPKARPTPPRKSEQCTRCGGMLPDCACKREHLAATYDDETPTERMDREAAMAAARAGIVAAKGCDGDETADEERA